MRNRLLIKRMNILCFIYINSRSIRMATKHEDKDKEAALLEGLMVEILLNQEDDLVVIDIIDENTDKTDWVDIDIIICA
jgi:hypothetical protein